MDDLRAGGFDDSLLARLHSPAGLSIGARTPAETAVAARAAAKSTAPAAPNADARNPPAARPPPPPPAAPRAHLRAGRPR
ncbi:XdhC family protein [Nocardia cyriacigeorgica]|uniref:XdhC family protein n=1 Tax=Nocardia cyriacigeorgica TaxID=135487 RepID=UPI0024568E40|nr:XdhC family protein [Nocardia cyriacigeorgica]